jgi:hypothetical protein
MAMAQPATIKQQITEGEHLKWQKLKMTAQKKNANLV